MNNKIVLVLLTQVIFPSFCFGGGVGTGKVRIEHVGGYGSGSLVMFETEAKSSAPTCNTFNGRWILDLSNPAGNAQYSLILAAQTSNKNVVVRGTGNCEHWNDSETVQWVGFPMN